MEQETHIEEREELPVWLSERLVSPKAYACDDIDEAYRWAVQTIRSVSRGPLGLILSGW